MNPNKLHPLISFLLFTISLLLILPSKINGQDIYKVTSVWMVNMTTKNQGDITGQEDNITFSISRNVIKLMNNGKVTRTFYVLNGYTFGWRDYAVPATYGDQEYCKVGLNKYDKCIIIMYPYLNTAITYYFQY